MSSSNVSAAELKQRAIELNFYPAKPGAKRKAANLPKDQAAMPAKKAKGKNVAKDASAGETSGSGSQSITARPKSKAAAKDAKKSSQPRRARNESEDDVTETQTRVLTKRLSAVSGGSREVQFSDDDIELVQPEATGLVVRGKKSLLFTNDTPIEDLSEEDILTEKVLAEDPA
ncbi:hypothetical protein HDU91_000712, partial [Kappamyces sp. JEL0680]